MEWQATLRQKIAQRSCVGEVQIVTRAIAAKPGSGYPLTIASVWCWRRPVSGRYEIVSIGLILNYVANSGSGWGMEILKAEEPHKTDVKPYGRIQCTPTKKCQNLSAPFVSPDSRYKAPQVVLRRFAFCSHGDARF